MRFSATAKAIVGEGVFLRSSLSLISGTVLSQAIVFLLSPFLSRIFGPADFGNLANFNAWLTFLVLLSNLRYEHAIIIARGRIGVNRVLGLVATLTAGSTIVVAALAAVLYVLNPGSYFHDLREVMPLIALAMMPSAISSALTNFNIRAGRFRRVATATVAAAGSTIGAQLLLGILHVKHGLILGTIAGSTVSAVLLAFGFLARNRLSHVGREMSLRRLRETAREHVDFPRYTLTADAITVVVQQFVPVFLLAMYDPVVAGFYAFSTRAVRVPLVVISSAVSNVLRREAPLHLASQGNLAAIFRGTVRTLSLLSIPPLLVLALFGPKLFVLVFGAKWADAGRVARILSPGVMLEFIAFPLTILFVVTRRQRITFRIQIVGLALLFGAVAAGRWIANDFFATCMLISAVMVVLNIATIILAARVSTKGERATAGATAPAGTV